MYRYFIEISYLGTNYCGWQIQANANTVQAELNKALSTILRQDVNSLGAGRTDTGVHAKYFVAHFDIEHQIDSRIADVMHGINNVLPLDIAVIQIYPVKPEAHARFSATSRTYQYSIHSRKNPFLTNLSWYLRYELDVLLMQKAADILLETTDFTSFTKLGSDVNNCDAVVSSAIWEEGENRLVFTIEANRFLRDMVRAVVGTIVDVGRGKITLDEFKSVIEKKDRRAAGMSAPAQGLALVDIAYPSEIYIHQ